MTYKYRVTLHGLKGFFRVYKVNSENSLYTFHKQMRADMGFPADQLILFKGLDADGGVVARYGLFDLGSGAADQITLSDTVKAGIVSFVYFYDTKNKKSVDIAFEGIIDEPCKSPELLESKGPDPIEFENGYVAFEDLPDEKRHLPGEGGSSSGAGSLGELLGLDPDDLDDDDEDLDDEEDDEDEDEDDDKPEEIYDDDATDMI